MCRHSHRFRHWVSKPLRRGSGVRNAVFTPVPVRLSSVSRGISHEIGKRCTSYSGVRLHCGSSRFAYRHPRTRWTNCGCPATLPHVPAGRGPEHCWPPYAHLPRRTNALGQRSAVLLAPALFGYPRDGTVWNAILQRRHCPHARQFEPDSRPQLPPQRLRALYQALDTLIVAPGRVHLLRGPCESDSDRIPPPACVLQPEWDARYPYIRCLGARDRRRAKRNGGLCNHLEPRIGQRPIDRYFRKAADRRNAPRNVDH